MTTALLVIDVQESFRDLDTWRDIDQPDIADRIVPLVEHTRATNGLVVWVLHSEPGSDDTFDPARGAVRLLPELRPAAGEPIVYKTSHNAFTTTNLAQQLQLRGITHLVITGIRTEQCCETTARVAGDLGYEVTFVLDATATHPLRMHDGRGTLTADQVKQRTAAALHNRFATVTTRAEYLAAAGLAPSYLPDPAAVGAHP